MIFHSFALTTTGAFRADCGPVVNIHVIDSSDLFICVTEDKQVILFDIHKLTIISTHHESTVHNPHNSFKTSFYDAKRCVL
jgi:hypothetical protein